MFRSNIFSNDEKGNFFKIKNSKFQTSRVPSFQIYLLKVRDKLSRLSRRDINHPSRAGRSEISKSEK